MTDIIERLNDEADLCKNEGADDIASLLWEAAATIATLRAEVEALRGLLAETQQFGAFGVGSTLAERINAAIDAAKADKEGA